jgi:3-methyladenine DNA glycosylase Mpg
MPKNRPRVRPSDGVASGIIAGDGPLGEHDLARRAAPSAAPRASKSLYGPPGVSYVYSSRMCHFNAVTREGEPSAPVKHLEPSKACSDQATLASEGCRLLMAANSAAALRRIQPTLSESRS